MLKTILKLKLSCRAKMRDSPPVWKNMWQLLWPEEESVLIQIDAIEKSLITTNKNNLMSNFSRENVTKWGNPNNTPPSPSIPLKSYSVPLAPPTSHWNQWKVRFPWVQNLISAIFLWERMPYGSFLVMALSMKCQITQNLLLIYVRLPSEDYIFSFFIKMFVIRSRKIL